MSALTLLIIAAFQWLGIHGLQSANITKGPENITIIYDSSLAVQRNAVFNCTFNGDPVPSIQWLNASSELFSNSSKHSIFTSDSSSVLTISNASVADIGWYTCNATNNETSDSSAAYLNIQVYTRITAHPKSHIVLEGSESLELVCDADGFPLPTFKWRKNGIDLADTAKIGFSADGKKLTFSIVNRNDTGNYTCVSSNGRSAISNIGLLTVHYIDAPKLNRSSEVVLNETDSFAVGCTVNSNPVAEYMWRSSSGNIVSSSSVLSFGSINRNENGTYTCSATILGDKTVSKDIKLTVQYIDKPIFNTSSTVNLIETSSLFVRCSAVSNPSAKFHWVTSSGTTVSNSAALVFGSINRNSSGNYSCVARNSFGTKSSRALTINVQYIDAPKLNRSSEVVLNETDSFAVGCTVNSNPVAEYMWRSSSGNIVSSSSVLSFGSINRNENGTYTCSATILGDKAVSKDIKLTVQYIDKPIFNTSSTVNLIETSSLFVRCSAVSSPSAKFHWVTSSGTTVSNSADLVFGSINRSSSGNYSCVARNSLGTKSSRALTINVQYIDAPKLNRSSEVVLNETDSFAVGCTVNSNPVAEYMWRSSSGNIVSSSSVLSFGSINRNENGTYTCSATILGDKTVSKDIKLTVQYIDKPIFNTSSTVNLIETSSLFVRCSAVSNPSAKFHWVTSSGTTVSNSADLVFGSINRNSSGNYSCVARNSLGTKSSRALTINVQYIDAPKLNRSSEVVLNETDSFAVGCTVNSNPVAEYIWRSSSGNIVSSSSVLSFGSINRNENGTYTCSATILGDKAVSKDIKLTVQYIDKPIFNTSSTVNLIETSSLFVRCSAVSNPSAKFHWVTSSGTTVSNSADLVFGSINRNSSGNYSCVARNSFGTKSSRTLTINVQYIDKPKFDGEPSVTVVENSGLNIVCSAKSNPAASYEWRSRSGALVSSSSILSFNPIHRNNSNVYFCNATNTVASKTSAELTVDVQSIDSPRFNTSRFLSWTEGRYLAIECFTEGYPITFFKWMTISGKVVSNSSVLSFKSLNRSDSNVYRCSGSNPAGTKTSANLTIDVQYIDSPRFNSSASVVLNEGASFKVQCSADANPHATYQWRTKSGKVVSVSSTLDFNAISRRNMSFYICIALNKIASKPSPEVDIRVQYLDAPMVRSSVRFKNGTASLVNCSVEGYPNVDITWLRGVTVKASGSQLKWNPILKSDAGRYICRGGNIRGIKESPTDVTVTYPPVVTVNSSKNLPNVTINENLVLTCDVDSVPTANISWKKDNGTLKSGSNRLNFEITTLQRNDSGIYTCVAQNSEGEIRIVKEVTVQEPPDAPRSFRPTNVASRWIVVEWKLPSFDGNSRVLYYELKFGTDASNLPNRNTRKTSDLNANVTGLSPFTIYHFRLSAVNGKGSSTVVKSQSKTESEPPPLKKDAISIPVPSLDTTTIKLKKFDNTYGIIRFYQVIVMQITSSSPSIVNTNLLNDLKKHSETKSGHPYVTAEFSGTVFDQSDEWDFTIGNKKLTSRHNTTVRARRAVHEGYYNAPLEPGSSYKAFYRAFVNDLQYTSTDWVQFKTKSKDEPLSAGAIIGIVLACLVPLIIIGAVVRYLRNKKEDGDEEEAGELKPHRPSVFKRSFLKSRLADPREPVSKASFEIHVNDLKSNSNYGFSQEYQMIDRSYRHSYSSSSAPINAPKNRYANIHPYDHSRVILQSDGTPGSDYINADYIRGFNGEKEYIAAQGPMPETIYDFWRMIWEQNCPAIVMLTNVQENGRQKCSQYWPKQGSIKSKDIIINVLEVLEYPDHVITTFHLTKSGENVERTVKHFHFVSWPDHGVPNEPSALFSLIKKVNRWRRLSLQKGALTVHCSAGVGRTGSYIVIDTQLNRTQNGKDITVFSNVTDIRDQRYLMVQTEDQYAYIHHAVLEYIKSGDTEIEAHELRDYIKRKSEVDTVSGSTGMMDEFVALAKDDSKHSFHEASKAFNQAKNRYKNVYPYDSTRVKLSQTQGLNGSDYINASFINGYIQSDAFIATQAPLERTFEDFWRMIWETDSRVIVMLSKEQEGGKVKVHPYWPNEGSIKSGILIMELLSKDELNEYTLRVFKITNSEEGQSRVVRHYQYTSWPETAPPESAFGIIDLIGQVSKWNTTVGNKAITVHCSAGVGRTGVFIALTNLIERLKTEAMVDVYQAVKKLRQQRTAMVQTRDQYEFCYHALQEYLDSFDHYANFE